MSNAKLWNPSQWQTEDGAPSIKIFPAAEADGGNKYLTDIETAGQQLQPAYALTAGTISWNNPLIIQSTDYIVSNINEANSTLHLLFEGAAAGRGQIVMQLLRNNKPFVDFPRVYLDIRDIKNLYERWSVDGPLPVSGEGAEPQRVATISKRDLPAGQSFGFQYRSDGNETPDNIAFVHGWNLNAFDKDADAETAFKRLYWQGFRGKFFAFQWPTTYGLNDTLDAALDRYNYDNGEDIAWKSAQPLAGLLGRLQAAYPGRVYLFGHSMGNVVCGEALRLLGRTGVAINTYAALEAAVEAECYDPATAFSYPLHYRYTHPRIPIGERDYDSGIPDIFGNWLVDANLGVQRKVSYYNENDYALYEDIWEFDQISKPDDAGVNVVWGWDGLRRPGTGLDLFWRLDFRSPPVANLALGAAGDVRDRYEIMAHISEPRSRALGRTPGGILGFDSNTNLQTLWPVSGGDFRLRPWHSAQFRFTNMDQNLVWFNLVGKFGLLP